MGRLEAGSPQPLGATPTGDGVNFALFSHHASRVELCLFAPDAAERRLDLPACTDGVWHGHLTDAGVGLHYGYRVHGPYVPEAGQRFNPNKLLLDPYARQLIGELRWHDALFAYTIGHPCGDLSFDERDSAPWLPKCVVLAEHGREHHRPAVPWSETIIYEAHLRGLTRLHPDIPGSVCGTAAALTQPVMLDYLSELGITAIELLPVHYFIDDRFLIERGMHNYWGYNPLNYFTPASRYLASRDIEEFQAMVAALHSVGIEVFIDVVYNHTAEGDQFGPTLSYRGIDNPSYYHLQAEPRFYTDLTGCGNTLNTGHPRVRQLIIDSLVYWTQVMGVDGFRFDLGTVLGREQGCFDANATCLDGIQQHPSLSGVKLIAEPWDLGADGYQLGAFPPPWREWNDKFRDSVRRLWRGDQGCLAEFARRIAGSAELFDRDGREPSATINFITAHDGFTLHDLLCYQSPHNAANGEGGADGHRANYSDNCGIEGSTTDATIMARRRRRRLSMLASLLFAQGTPMLLAGDELGRTQGGNNNAYCQDNADSWLNWASADRALLDWVRRMIAIRKAHPVFQGDGFLHGDTRSASTGFRNIQWLNTAAEPFTQADWHAPEGDSLALLLGDFHEDRQEDIVLLLINAGDECRDFKLPDTEAGGCWITVLDTSASEADGEQRRLSPAASYALSDNTLALLRWSGEERP